MAGELWNLVAATLCTIGALIVTAAAVLSAPSIVNTLAAIGAAIGAAGGVACHRGEHCFKAAAMNGNELLLVIALVLMVTNCLGAGFTISRMRAKARSRPRAPASHGDRVAAGE
ncbi:MAG TPA: hypothetical protein VG651_23875 [Stellaceae bacterium]|nr:hypothetical protein [Stellaceae bacterium]